MAANPTKIVRLLLTPVKLNAASHGVGIRTFTVFAGGRNRFAGRRLSSTVTAASHSRGEHSSFPGSSAVHLNVPHRSVSTPVNTIVKFVPHQEGKETVAFEVRHN